MAKKILKHTDLEVYKKAGCNDQQPIRLVDPLNN